jgi:hypothetical protein
VIAVIIDWWRYASITISALALGLALAMLKQRWFGRWRWAQLGVCLFIVALIVANIIHLGDPPLLPVYLQIIAALTYTVGHWLGRKDH